MSTRTTATANSRLDTEYGSGTAGGYFVAALTVITSGAAGTVTEASGGNYARQAISFAAAASRSKPSNAEIDFGESDFDHGDIVGWGIYTAVTAGTLKHVITLQTPIPYDIGFQPKIASGDLSITEAAFA
jgi:hypothetical protein